MLTEAAQFEMTDFNDRCRNFGSKSTSHEQWPANILADEFQPAEDVDVAPDGGEVEAIARANIARLPLYAVSDQTRAAVQYVAMGQLPMWQYKNRKFVSLFLTDKSGAVVASK